MKLYHGSDKVISNPIYGFENPDNDYGRGFYTTEDIEKAREWAIVNGKPGQAYCNAYELNEKGLSILELDNYGTLSWIAEIVYNRGIEDKRNENVTQSIIEKYKIDTTKADVIIGYRADDSYTKIVDAFLNKKLTIAEVDRMFREGKLGKQVFIKSQKAFNHLTFIDAEEVIDDIKYGESERQARQKITKILNKREDDIIISGLDVNNLGLTIQDAVNSNLVFIDGYYQKGGGPVW